MRCVVLRVISCVRYIVCDVLYAMCCDVFLCNVLIVLCCVALFCPFTIYNKQ